MRKMDPMGQGQGCPKHVLLLYLVTMWRQNIINSLQILHFELTCYGSSRNLKFKEGFGLLCIKYKTCQKPFL